METPKGALRDRPVCRRPVYPTQLPISHGALVGKVGPETDAGRAMICQPGVALPELLADFFDAFLQLVMQLLLLCLEHFWLSRRTVIGLTEII